jgi:hypothetical protein
MNYKAKNMTCLSAYHKISLYLTFPRLPVYKKIIRTHVRNKFKNNI